jgi:hypothetical protein
VPSGECDGDGYAGAALPAELTAPPIGPLVVFGSDAGALGSLAEAERRPEVVDEPGDGWALWRVAHELRLAPDTAHLDDRRSRLGLAAALAAAALPPGPPAIGRITAAAFRLALDRWRAPEAMLRGPSREALAQEAGLWPVPSTRADGLPCGLDEEAWAALARAGRATRELFRMAAEGLAAGDTGAAGPAPGARPVLLAPPPPSGEPGESAEISRYLRLRLPLAAVPPPEPAAVAARLGGAFPWMEAAVTAVARELALAGLGREGVCRIPPLLLVGLPGSGKTHFARALAEACGLPLYRLAAPDPSAATHLAGIGRGWRSARPSAPLRAILEGGVRNPLMCIDDVDRAPTEDRNGAVSAVLLGLLEPESARRHEDPLLAVPTDLSAVNWVLTANSVDPLPDALLDRLLRIDVPPPPPSALPGVVSTMTDGIAAELGVDRDALPELPAAVHDTFTAAFAADRGALRRIRLGLRAALGAAALGADPLAAVQDALRPQAPSSIGFPRSATHAR